jgi:hypothetical protein
MVRFENKKGPIWLVSPSEIELIDSVISKSSDWRRKCSAMAGKVWPRLRSNKKKQHQQQKQPATTVTPANVSVTVDI